jgi:4-hydroxy-2-oxoheptanedioate aldolase
MQHGVVDYQAALRMLQVIGTTHTTPLARIPWNDPAIIMKMLDAGCYGLICPMVNTRAQCEAFVGACLYPPKGYRSIGPTRVSYYAGTDYVPNANANIMPIAMIETKEAVDNLDAILTTPGLVAIYVGPADLAQSYGKPPRADHTDPFMVDIIDRIVDGCKRHGIYAGIHTASTDYAIHAIEKGFQLTTILADSRLLATAAAAAVKAVKEGQKTGVAPTGAGPY